MTRLLHVLWEYPPVIYGGLARHAEALTRAQVAAGHEVQVLTAAQDLTRPRRRVRPGDAVRRGVRVRRVRPGADVNWSYLLAAADGLEAALEAGGRDLAADVVHGHDWIGARSAARLAARAGVPFVLTVHATEWGRHGGRDRVGDADPAQAAVTAAVHARERLAVAAAAVVVVCSTAMRAEVVEALGADPARVRVVPNAVDVARWRCGPVRVRRARQQWLAGPDLDPTDPVEGPLLVAAGRLEWEKGFSTLIRAMPSLLELFPGLRVVLAGRGSYADRLVALAEEVGVRRHLSMPGWLAARDLASLYAACDAVVVPSRYEPSGLVAREAQAAGAVVVATDVGGLGEAVVDGRTGLQVGVGDVHGLRDALAALLTDPDRARALADAGRRAVRSYTWARAAEQVTAAYPVSPAS